jgi:hypothetical protein
MDLYPLLGGIDPQCGAALEALTHRRCLCAIYFRLNRSGQAFSLANRQGKRSGTVNSSLSIRGTSMSVPAPKR